jgi:hypothetical protein
MPTSARSPRRHGGHDQRSRASVARRSPAAHPQFDADGDPERAVNRAAQSFRLAAAALHSSKSALGAYFRRMCSRRDKPKAVAAAANKLARLIYTMLTKGEEYTDKGQGYYEERYRERVLRALSQRAAKLGKQMTPIAQPA